MDSRNRIHLKRILAKNIFNQQVKDTDFEILKIEHSGSFGYITVQPKLNSRVTFTKRVVRFEKFKLQDYKLKESDNHLLVPASKAKNKIDLINYMNSIFLHSVQVKENSFLNSYQFILTEQDLKPFNISDPQVNSTITLYAKSDCDLFSGSLIIKFV